MTKIKNKKLMKGLLISALIVAVIAVSVTVVNYLSVQNLLQLGSSYAKVEIENQLVPEKNKEGNWCFTTDGDFKVMQLTDIHIGGGFMSRADDEKALNAIALMVTKEKPDLVIATGDITFPVPYRAGTFNNYSGAKAFANLMKALVFIGM